MISDSLGRPDENSRYRASARTLIRAEEDGRRWSRDEMKFSRSEIGRKEVSLDPHAPDKFIPLYLCLSIVSTLSLTDSIATFLLSSLPIFLLFDASSAFHLVPFS